jgi:hypothetical protein
MKIYKIATVNENGSKLYFNEDYCFFSEKFGTQYKGKKAAASGLEYAKKCASSQTMLENLHIEIS